MSADRIAESSAEGSASTSYSDARDAFDHVEDGLGDGGPRNGILRRSATIHQAGKAGAER
jgi:hypothetical protein